MPPADGLFRWVNQLAARTPWLHAPMTGMAKYGLVIFAALIVVGWWMARRRTDEVMAAALLTPAAAVLALLVQQLLVGAVHEARPYAVHPGALVLIARTSDPSFPSDHACVAGAVAVGLFFVDRRLGWVAGVLAVVMAFARVYVGAHWPLDVVAGLAVGGALAALTILLARRPVARLVGWARANALRPLVATAA
jgi:undecaprenyl-diphosphatase